MSNGPGFRITDGKGFHITFENGARISVQFGGQDYCDHRGAGIGGMFWQDQGRRGSTTAEVAGFRPNGEWYLKDEVAGGQTPAQVLKLMKKLAALPPVTPQQPNGKDSE